MSGKTHQYLGMYLKDQNGDFDYSVKVSMRSRSNRYSRVGLFVANNAADFGSGGLFLCSLSGKKGILVQYASKTKGKLDKQYAAGTSALPVYLRVKKVGNAMTCFYRTETSAPWIVHPNSPVKVNSTGPTFDVGLLSSARSIFKSSIVELTEFRDNLFLDRPLSSKTLKRFGD